MPNFVANPYATSVKETKELAVDKATKKLKCTSCCLILVGGLSAIGAFYHMTTAREEAERIYRHETGKVSETFSREEFTLYDNIKNLTFFALLLSLAVLGLGKCGMKAAKEKKAKSTRKMRCKSMKGLIAIIVFGCATTHFAHKFGKTIKHLKP